MAKTRGIFACIVCLLLLSMTGCINNSNEASINSTPVTIIVGQESEQVESGNEGIVTSPASQAVPPDVVTVILEAKMVDPVRGRKAHTVVKPEELQGKKSKVHIEITTGRTHQIRVHLAHIGHPIVGDEQYGSRTQSKRILLHSAKMKILDYEFSAAEPKDIARYK